MIVGSLGRIERKEEGGTGKVGRRQRNIRKPKEDLWMTNRWMKSFKLEVDKREGMEI